MTARANAGGASERPGELRRAGAALLQAAGVSVSFGGVQALVDVDLEVGERQLVGLIGPNGAGKTTFIDAVSGFVRCRGQIELDGFDLAGVPPHGRARLGLARTWQSVELFDDLSVRENLAVAAGRPSLWASIREALSPSPEDAPAVDAALGLLGLEPVADALPGDLTQSERKHVGIARALAAQPRVICLDEPAAGLDAGETQELGRRLRDVVDGGPSILLVDHDMGLVLGICDRVVVLEFGRVIADGPADDVRRDPDVVKAYLGSAAAEVAG
jgi:branched-chain amino acid transport system ATP-binding protein